MYDNAIKNLQTCDALDACEMYVSIVDNNKRFGVRLWGGLDNMTSDEAKAFCDEFNAATKAVRDKWLRKYRDKVVGVFLGGRDLA